MAFHPLGNVSSGGWGARCPVLLVYSPPQRTVCQAVQFHETAPVFPPDMIFSISPNHCTSPQWLFEQCIGRSVLPAINIKQRCFPIIVLSGALFQFRPRCALLGHMYLCNDLCNACMGCRFVVRCFLILPEPSVILICKDQMSPLMPGSGSRLAHETDSGRHPRHQSVDYSGPV